LISFFESSPTFIQMACEKLRKTHGAAFKLSTVKALMQLRTDLTREEKREALNSCREVLTSYKREEMMGGSQRSHMKGIFDQLDTKQAEMNFQKDEEEEGGHDKVEDDEDDPGFDIEDFLREGGINLDELDEDEQEITGENKTGEEEEEKIVGSNKMSGYLYKQGVSMKKDNNLFVSMISAVTSTVKSTVNFVADQAGNLASTIFTNQSLIKGSRRFFAIKNGVLYWYNNDKAREAMNKMMIKDIK
jgi:hypothetical protein